MKKTRLAYAVRLFAYSYFCAWILFISPVIETIKAYEQGNITAKIIFLLILKLLLLLIISEDYFKKEEEFMELMFKC